MWRKNSKFLKFGIFFLVLMVACANIISFPGLSTESTKVSAASTLPTHLLTGYWHNFDNKSKCLRLRDVPTTYTIVCISFADAVAPTGSITFKLDSTLSNLLGGYTEEEFIQDVKLLQSRGQKVIISVGGEAGNVTVSDSTHAANFANSTYALMQKYGFDGVDIDLEHGINAAALTTALRSLSSKVGPSLIITMAPQTIDMQSTNTQYFKLALNIKDILTICNMQYYNSGTMNGYDGKVYALGDVDFLTALATIQLEGGLRPDQVGLGVPAVPRAAGSGYVDPKMVNDALDCLATGKKVGDFTPPNKYPTIRGAMTWSINWDATNNYNWSNTIYNHMKGLPGGLDTPVPTSTPTPTPSTPPPGITLSGYVDTALDYPQTSAVASLMKSGFKVDVAGTTHSAVTDNNGYFNIPGITEKSAGYTLKISKKGYLPREINVSGTKSQMVGTPTAPVKMWIGDFNNDGAINMSDIVELVNYFNTAPGDGKYNADFDLNKDNAINMTDILIIIEHFNTTTVNYPTNDFEIKVITDPIGGTSTPKPTNTPTPTPDNGIKEWSSDNVSYKLGDKVSYQGSIYECTYAHSSNTAWTPVAAGTLWKKI